MNVFAEESSIFRDSNIFQARSLFTREPLPWDDVAVMLHLAEHDAVAESNIRPTPGVSREVYCLRRSSDEDYL